jgi:hypothetical protein
MRNIPIRDAGSKIVPVGARDHAVMANGEGLGSIRQPSLRSRRIIFRLRFCLEALVTSGPRSSSRISRCNQHVERIDRKKLSSFEDIWSMTGWFARAVLHVMDVTYPMKEIAADFEKSAGCSVRVS